MRMDATAASEMEDDLPATAGKHEVARDYLGLVDIVGVLKESLYSIRSLEDAKPYSPAMV